MSKGGIVYLLILNVNAHASAIPERSTRANEGHIGVTIMKRISTEMNGYFL